MPYLYILLLTLISLFTYFLDDFKLLFIEFLSLFIILIFMLITKHNIKGWYLSSLFISLYVFPHFYSIYVYGDNFILKNNLHNLIATNLEYNIEGIKLVINYILFSYMGCLVFMSTKKHMYIKTIKNFKLSKLKLWSIYIIVAVLLLLAISKLDFKSISEQYTLGSGFSILFGIFYIINFYILLIFIKNDTNKYFFILLLISYFTLLGFLGVRQIILWLLLSFLIIYIYKKRYIEYQNINWKKIILYFILFLFISSIILGYRDNKEINLDMKLIISLIGFAYLWETTFTVYNLFASINLSEKIDFFFMRDFLDFFVFLVPSFLFPSKTEYLILNEFSKLYEITPYGTYFILGELKLSLRYDILIFLYASIISFISEMFLHKVRKDNNNILLILYASFIVYCFIYPVRGSIPSGLKIFVMFNLFFYIFLKYKFVFEGKTK